MMKAQDIVNALYSNDGQKIEQAFAQYNPSLEKEVIDILEKRDPEVIKLQLSKPFNQPLICVFNCTDEYYLRGTINVKRVKIRCIKVEYSYGRGCWEIDPNSNQDLSDMLSAIKGNCWDNDLGGYINIVKPGNDVFKYFLEDSKMILEYYDTCIDSLDQAREHWSEEEMLYSYQYLEGLSFYVQYGDSIVIQKTTSIPLMLFLAMKNSINIQNIEAYQLAPTEGDPSFWRLMGMEVYPDIKPSDWIII
jgi:hypothetical protein